MILVMTHTRVLELRGGRGDAGLIREAAEALREGSIVVFPTETVYGLGCSAASDEAVRRLYSLKGRRADKPLAFYIASKREVTRFVDRIPGEAEKVMDRFWPGPLTIVLPGGGAGRAVAFRFPDDASALALISEAGVPLVATSANRSGEPPPRSGEEAEEAMSGLADIVLKGGRTRYGGESTILDLSAVRPRLLREGIIQAGEIEGILGVTMK